MRDEDDPRLEPFGYVCRRCLKCCRHKRIQLNPYEVARLARNQRLSTTAFRAEFTQEGAGFALSQTEDGACVFLGPEGCTVHSDRPLVCRLYPLGRHVEFAGAERFSRVTPHPQSAGEVTGDGTIANFLEEQGAAPFLTAADEYLEWFARALELLPEAGEPLTDGRDPADEAQIDPAAELLDMDAAIADHASRTGSSPPADVEGRKALHLRILYQQLSSQEGIDA